MLSASAHQERCAGSRKAKLRLRLGASLPGASAALGLLLLAGCHGGNHSQDIASGKDFSLSAGELAQALASSPQVSKSNAEAVRDQVLHKLIDEKLLANAATKEGLDHEPATIQTLMAAQRSILARAYAMKLTAGIGAPGEPEIAAYYQANPQIFANRVSADVDEYLFQGPPQATANVIRLFNSGTPLDRVVAVATQQGVLISRQDATLTSDTVPLDVVAKLDAATVGSNIAFGSNSAMIVAHVNVLRQEPLNLSQAAPLIREKLLQQRKSQVLKKELDRLRAVADVKINVAPAARQPAQQTK